MSADRPTLPPVRLHSEAELARDVLSAPLMARAAKLARWAEPGVPVGVGGELLQEPLAAATEHLGLAGDEDGPAYTAEAWQLAVDTGLVEVEETAEAADGETADDLPDDTAAGTATPGEELRLLTSASPQDVLEIWLGGLDTVLADAAAPDLSGIAEQLADGGELDLDAIDWNPEEEAELLDGILGNLYLLTALSESPDQDVPLPALAASMIVPDDMDEPTDDILEEVSEAMMRLDDQFRVLEPIGLVAYRPVDEALIEELDEDGETALPGSGPEGTPGAEPLADEDVARYGLVRLTPLGIYAVRARMLDAGVHAPAVGDLTDKGADVLLDALPDYPEALAQAESEQWLAARTPVDAARDLLSAARGDDERAPLRRLAAQQTLSLVTLDAEAALREVLDDRQLGGLARVWLAERAVSDIPEPSQDMIFWLTVDTLAAQLGSADDEAAAELRDLVRGLTEQHSGFFDAAWRVDHPATAEVLEAMGRLHPDRKAAKEARKAAFKARSRQGG
ncbi:cytochrome P450 [Streptomyces halobius]|uniref:Cytochrome P450 n=1 Tax=Streptomyces halobius TaxID=2879846 RepID=A0ABY4MFT2_9ACTN|nr:cytochrome P450 [Streptomyces halobius]UQA96137.1 cytochrome P450 [Streptomyces halobius]